MQDNTTYDLTTCNNDGLGRNKFMFFIFPRFKVFNNIHEYTNQI